MCLDIKAQSMLLQPAILCPLRSLMAMMEFGATGRILCGQDPMHLGLLD